MDLRTYIRAVPDFPKKGVLFRDITPLLGCGQAFRQCIADLGAQKGIVEADAIAAFDARGFIFGAALAYELGKPLILLRKKGKLPHKTVSQAYGLEYGESVLEIHADAVSSGERVALVDDILATGGTALAGCRLVESLGGVVSGCHFVIELSDLRGREALAGYPVHALFPY